MRRLKAKHKKHGFHALFDGRRGKAGSRRAAIEVVEEVLRLYLEKYFDFNVKHFYEKLTGERGIGVSYTLTKQSRSVSEPMKSKDSVKPMKPIKKPKAKAAAVGKKVN